MIKIEYFQDKIDNVEAEISGATMAWILGKAPLMKNGDETHAIFGTIQVQNVKGQITDSQADHTQKTAKLRIRFITKLPELVWNRYTKEWNHGYFKKFESQVQKLLGLEARIVGLARFRQSGGQLLVSNVRTFVLKTRPIDMKWPLLLENWLTGQFFIHLCCFRGRHFSSKPFNQSETGIFLKVNKCQPIRNKC